MLNYDAQPLGSKIKRKINKKTEIYIYKTKFCDNMKSQKM